MTDSIQVPRGPLIGAACLIALTIISAGVARLSGDAVNRPTGMEVASRDLRFADQADGSVTVIDVGSGHAVERLAPGSNGFLRASLRSLAHRRVFSGDNDQSFHLTAWSDGRLTLNDPESGGLIDLEAFGPTNEAVFAGFLEFRSSAR